MKKLCYIFVLGLFAVFFVSCDGDETINLGVLAPLTGEGARYGEAMKAGLDLGLLEYTEGNDNNYSLALYYQDTKFSQKEALNGYNYLKTIKNTSVIFGPAASGISSTIAPYANRDKIILMSSISTADKLKSAGDYFFRNISPNSFQANSIIDHILKNESINTLAVFYENNDYGINMSNVLKQLCDSNRLDIIFQEPYEFGENDYKNIIAKVRNINENPDIIIIPGTTKGIALLTKQLRESGFDQPIYTGDGGYGKEISEIAGSMANGLICTLTDVEDKTTSAYLSFQQKYIELYNEEPDIYSVYSYDAFNLIVSIINKLDRNDINGENIQKMLHKTTYIGIAGDYTFDIYGGVNKPFQLFEYRNGKYIRVN